MPRFDLTTIGEASLRMSVPAGQRLETTQRFDVNISGAEANVAGGLAQLGWSCGWISRLPDNATGYRVRHAFAPAGFDMSAVSWADEGNLATLFVEYSVPPRATQVYFDRKNSCFTRMQIDQVRWDYLFDTRLLHLTGITAALSDSCLKIVSEAVEQAKLRKIPISFDVNFRQKMWTVAAARKALLPLIQDIELLFCSKRDAETLFDCEGTTSEQILQLHHLTRARHIIMSLGDAGVTGYDGHRFTRGDAMEVTVLDRIGAGDGLAAGVIHGWLKNDFARGLQYGTAMAALVLSQYGEMVITSPAELEKLLDQSRLDIER